MTVLAAPNLQRSSARVVVTGGCGFIGCNLANALAARGQDVLVIDSLSRSGAQENAEWLKARHPDRVAIERLDVRDAEALRPVLARAKAVLHLAAQVAVTTSLQDPLEDFEINGRGTLNLLETLRCFNPRAPLIYASTNKVYGKLLDEGAFRRAEERYVPVDERLHGGVDEDTPLDFYSPYGCSKGTADQYVRDYARVFGLNTVVLRMSCIYGPRQFGTEDQGWIAHFLLQAIARNGITIYGDGFQVRDALFVDDAVAAWLAALDRIAAVRGQVFNLGGGPGNSISLRECLAMIEELRGEPLDIVYAEWRPGDQPWYVSDVRRVSAALDWSPRVGLWEGLRALDHWLDGRFGSARDRPQRKEARA